MLTAGGLALIIIGAILKWAVTVRTEGIDLDILGLILMYGGGAGLLIGLVLTWSRRRREDRQPPPYGYPDDRYYDDPPRW